MLGADYSSKLSPWLANGCISPRHVAAECAKYEATRVKNKSPYWLVFELLWRDFFRQYTEKHGANVFKVEGPARAKRPWRDDPEMLRRWKEGARYIELLIASSAIGVDSTWIRDTCTLRIYTELLLYSTPGQLGVPLVDANMRELAATGFMSNRGRQIVASYFALDLGLDWRAGAIYSEPGSAPSPGPDRYNRHISA